jgi:hypothetical protein
MVCDLLLEFPSDFGFIASNLIFENYLVLVIWFLMLLYRISEFRI